MKNHSFAKGAFLLALATALGKIFSAIFKIPLDRFFLHADGMAVFNSAYNIYMFFFAAATGGIPLAVSRLIASCETERDRTRILSATLVFLEAALSFFALLLFVFARPISLFIGMPSAAPSLRVMAPALVFCGITASFKGYFQGKMSMLPPALSQIFDSFGRLLLGFLLALAFCTRGQSAVSACAIAGVPFGAFLSALILVIAYRRSAVRFSFSFSFDILKSVFFLALPLTLTTSLHAVFNLIDTSCAVPLLSAFGFSAPASAFGSLGRAAMLYVLPVSIATSVAASALPSVTQLQKSHNAPMLKNVTSLALRLSLAVSVPCAAGFAALPSGIFSLLFDNTAHSSVLFFIAPSAVFLSFGCTLSGILQGLGKTRFTVYAALAAIFSKLCLNLVLIPFYGIDAAAVSSSVSYLVFSALSVVFALRHTSLRFSPVSLFLQPIFCALVTFAAAKLFSSFASVPVAICLTALCYAVLVPVSHFITPSELKLFFSRS